MRAQLEESSQAHACLHYDWVEGQQRVANHLQLDWAMDGVKRRLGFLYRSVGALHLGQGVRP
jgi:hypothetical protein